MYRYAAIRCNDVCSSLFCSIVYFFALFQQKKEGEENEAKLYTHMLRVSCYASTESLNIKTSHAMIRQINKGGDINGVVTSRSAILATLYLNNTR